MQNITTGTEAQNRFAEDIRSQVIEQMNEDLSAHGYTAEMMMEANPQIAAIMNINDIGFWLDVVKPDSKDIRSIAANPLTANYL